jgi:hypothetical protein
MIEFTLPSNNNRLNAFKKIYSFSQSRAILTGSIALILLEKIHERECADIDIVVPYFIDFSDVAKKVKRISNPYTTPAFEIELSDEYGGYTLHCIIDPACFYTTMKLSESEEIKVSNYEDIIIEKMKSYVLFGSVKNKADIQDFFKIEDEKATVKIEDLPY